MATAALDKLNEARKRFLVAQHDLKTARVNFDLAERALERAYVEFKNSLEPPL